MGKKKTFSNVSLTSLLLCLAMLGWGWYSLSNTSIINWGSGEVWATNGKLVMTDKSISESPETKFFVRSVPYVQGAQGEASVLREASLGYYSKDLPKVGTFRSLVLPIWGLAILFAFAPAVALLKSKNSGKKDGKPAGAH